VPRVRGLIREDFKRLEEERLEHELLKGLRSGQGIPMTTAACQQLKAEAAKRIQASAHHHRSALPLLSFHVNIFLSTPHTPHANS
jgi:hypothetical protein